MQSYSQSTEYTTAAAGLLAILHDKDSSFALSKENELEIWRASVNLPTRASSIFGLATFAKKHGLNPSVIVESLVYDYPDYRFNRYTKKDIDLAKETHALHVQHAKKLNISVEEREITFEEIKTLILKGKILLLRVNEGFLRGTGSTSKYVVLYGSEKGEFLILDPIQENSLIRVKETALQESFDTLTSKKKRDHRMIVF